MQSLKYYYFNTFFFFSLFIATFSNFIFMNILMYFLFATYHLYGISPYREVILLLCLPLYSARCYHHLFHFIISLLILFNIALPVDKIFIFISLCLMTNVIIDMVFRYTIFPPDNYLSYNVIINIVYSFTL